MGEESGAVGWRCMSDCRLGSMTGDRVVVWFRMEFMLLLEG